MPRTVKFVSFAAATLAVSVVHQATAADLAVKAPVYKAVPAAGIDWSGFYLGVHGGWGSAQNRGTYSDFIDSGVMDFPVNGGIVGGQIGYNYMIGRALYGIELDGSWADLKGSSLDRNANNREFKTDALASARFRSGVAIDNLLLFSTVGVGYAHSKFTVTGSTPASASQSLDAVGVVSGFGAEWAVAPNWSLRAEYLYYYFDKRTDIPGLTTASYRTDFVKLDGINVIRVGANYKFGGGLTRSAARTASVDWSGFYVGAHAGYGSSRMPGVYDDAGDGGSLNIDPRGFIGGGQIGYNWQRGNWVYGVEADGTWGAMDKSRVDNENDTEKLKTDALASLRARVGVAYDDKLFYLTGGLGYAHSSLTVTGDSPAPAKIELSSWGAVVGSGVDWSFAPNWSARLEGLTYFFNNRKNISNLTSDSDQTDTIRQSMVSVVRLGVNYKFGGPVVAKY